MDRLIASFQVDHTRIGYGIFVSRRDVVNGAYITTFDVRMKRPNAEPAIHPNAVHTIEHIVATYLRNSKFKDHVVYWGPMGCLTGFYFITNTAHEIMPTGDREAYEGGVQAYGGVSRGSSRRDGGQLRKLSSARPSDGEIRGSSVLEAGMAFRLPQGSSHQGGRPHILRRLKGLCNPVRAGEGRTCGWRRTLDALVWRYDPRRKRRRYGFGAG